MTNDLFVYTLLRKIGPALHAAASASPPSTFAAPIAMSCEMGGVTAATLAPSWPNACHAAKERASPQSCEKEAPSSEYSVLLRVW